MNQDDIKPFQTIKASDARLLRKQSKPPKARKKIEKSAHSKALDAADDAFSLYFRAKEADEHGIVRCCTCGKYMKWKMPDGSAQTGHWQSRGFNRTRFNEMNVGIQDRQCNYYLEGAKKIMEAYLIERYGEEPIKQIEVTAPIRKDLNDFELRELAKFYRAEARKLIKQKGLV
mgnify:FL=1